MPNQFSPASPSLVRESNADVVVVGAGLVGSLLALLLARRGLNVEVLERRADMRREKVEAGRSINLAVSTRGITALNRAGLSSDVLAQAVPMYGRMMHSLEGALTFQPYGKDKSEYINSISRAAFNQVLIERAEETGKVKFDFQQKALGLDFEHNTLKMSDLKNTSGEVEYQIKAPLVIGTDGSASKIRDDMSALKGHSAHASRLDYGYKELYIPPAPEAESGFAMEKNALHIWPRGTYLLIALPNFDGSFTCTLFLPYEGPVSFEHLTSEDSVDSFFREQFADAHALIPDLAVNFVRSPLGHMDTVKAMPWNVGDKVLLLGDAAHAIVPFYGQGANCGFEDLTVFENTIDEYLATGGSLESGWQVIFDKMTARRKVNCDAISDMAVENFVEMRDRVGDPHFLLMKAVEKILEKNFPNTYKSRYSLVTFSNAPYKLAQDVGVICEEILNQLCKDLCNPAEVNLALAKSLIDEKLAPLLQSTTF